MITVNLVQGSPEWHAFRAKKFTASDAPAAMGLSKYKKRDQLLKEKATGITEEVTPELQRRFDDGHKTEELARVNFEGEFGEELYPVTGYHDTNQKIAASLDGMDMLGTFLFEHKIWNQALVDFIQAHNDLPDTHWPQLEQQLYVSGADYCDFVVSDGTKDKRIIHKYFSQPERLKAVLAAWDQFTIDLDGYEAKAPTVKVEAQRIDALPVLAIEINGSVKSSNLATYKDTLLARIDSINTDLSTDQDFADAEAVVKFCKKAEDELKNAEKLVLGQVSDINAAIQTIADLAKAMRDKRLTLDKLVKSRKEQIKLEMIQAADKVLLDHIGKINATFTQPWLPLIQGDFAGAIKGKKNVDAMQSAINDELASCKISVNEMADTVRTNIKTITELGNEYTHLLPDLGQLINQEPLAFRGLVQGRIADHKEAEAQRQAAIEAEAQRQAELETQRQADLVAVQPTAEKPALEIVSDLNQALNTATPQESAFKEDDNDKEKLGVLLFQLKGIQFPECVNAEHFDLVSECRNALSDMAAGIDAAIKKINAAA